MYSIMNSDTVYDFCKEHGYLNSANREMIVKACDAANFIADSEIIANLIWLCCDEEMFPNGFYCDPVAEIESALLSDFQSECFGW